MDFEVFFADNYGSVAHSLGVIIGDRDRGEELAQEAFARAFRHWRRVSDLDHPVMWIMVVALNHERSRWRRERRAPLPRASPPASDQVGAVATKLLLQDALAQLTDRQRAAVVLRYLADLSIKDVARVMRCAEGTVKATLHQSLRRLRVDLEGDDL